MLKIQNFFLLLISLLFTLSAAALDFSGYDVKMAEFKPRPEEKDSYNYDEYFKKLCPQKYGTDYKFSGYIEQQNAWSEQQKQEMVSLQKAGAAAYVQGNFAEFNKLRESYFNLLAGQGRRYYASCILAGPSKKATWEKNINKMQVDLEMFLLRTGYYEFKIKLINIVKGN